MSDTIISAKDLSLTFRTNDGPVHALVEERGVLVGLEVLFLDVDELVVVVLVVLSRVVPVVVVVAVVVVSRDLLLFVTAFPDNARSRIIRLDFFRSKEVFFFFFVFFFLLEEEQSSSTTTPVRTLSKNLLEDKDLRPFLVAEADLDLDLDRDLDRDRQSLAW